MVVDGWTGSDSCFRNFHMEVSVLCREGDDVGFFGRSVFFLLVDDGFVLVWYRKDGWLKQKSTLKSNLYL